MSVTIAGILKDGMGNFLPNVRLELHAKKTSSQVIINSEAVFYTNNTGNYSFTVLTGSYSLFIDFGSVGPQYIGEINILVDSINGTLENFLTIPGEEEITPEILQQVLQARLDAQTAAQQAARSALEAAQSAQNAAGLQAPYKDDAAAQAAITAGTIPNGGVLSVVGTDPNVAYTFKFNNNGTLETILDTNGKPKIFPNFLWYLTQLSRLDTNIAQALGNGGLFNYGGVNAFEIASVTKKIALYLDMQARLGVPSGMFTLGNNKFNPLPENSEYAFVFSDEQSRVVFGLGKKGWIEVLGMRLYRTADNGNALVIADGKGVVSAELSNNGRVTAYDSNSTPIPIPVLKFAEWLHIFIYGQSLSNGAIGTPVLGTPTTDSLMFNTGVRTNGLTPTSLVPLAEQNTDTNGETIASGLAHSTVAHSGGMYGRKLLLNAGGVNGARISEISKGKSAYTQLIARLNQAAAIAAAEGREYSCDYMMYMQGEGDMAVGVSQSEYEALLIQLYNDLNNDTRAIRSSGKELVMFIYQTSSHGFYVGTQANPSEVITQAQLNVALTHSHIDMWGPTYMGLPGNLTVNQGNVHHSNHGYRVQGLYSAKALRHRLSTISEANPEGEKYLPVHVKSVKKINDNVAIAEVHTYHPPFVIDSSLVTELLDGNHGIELWNPGERLPITGIEIVGGTKIRVTTSGVIGAGAYLAVAWTPENRGAATDLGNGLRYGSWFFGRQTGVRTTIHDSDPESTDLNAENGLPYPLQNYLAIQKIEVTV